MVEWGLGFCLGTATLLPGSPDKIRENGDKAQDSTTDIPKRQIG